MPLTRSGRKYGENGHAGDSAGGDDIQMADMSGGSDCTLPRPKCGQVEEDLGLRKRKRVSSDYGGADNLEDVRPGRPQAVENSKQAKGKCPIDEGRACVEDDVTTALSQLTEAMGEKAPPVGDVRELIDACRAALGNNALSADARSPLLLADKHIAMLADYAHCLMGAIHGKADLDRYGTAFELLATLMPVHPGNESAWYPTRVHGSVRSPIIPSQANPFHVLLEGQLAGTHQAVVRVASMGDADDSLRRARAAFSALAVFDNMATDSVSIDFTYAPPTPFLAGVGPSYYARARFDLDYGIVHLNPVQDGNAAESEPMAPPVIEMELLDTDDMLPVTMRKSIRSDDKKRMWLNYRARIKLFSTGKLSVVLRARQVPANESELSSPLMETHQQKRRRVEQSDEQSNNIPSVPVGRAPQTPVPGATYVVLSSRRPNSAMEICVEYRPSCIRTSFADFVMMGVGSLVRTWRAAAAGSPGAQPALPAIDQDVLAAVVEMLVRLHENDLPGMRCARWQLVGLFAGAADILDGCAAAVAMLLDVVPPHMSDKQDCARLIIMGSYGLAAIARRRLAARTNASGSIPDVEAAASLRHAEEVRHIWDIVLSHIHEIDAVLWHPITECFEERPEKTEPTLIHLLASDAASDPRIGRMLQRLPVSSPIWGMRDSAGNGLASFALSNEVVVRHVLAQGGISVFCAANPSGLSQLSTAIRNCAPTSLDSRSVMDIAKSFASAGAAAEFRRQIYAAFASPFEEAHCESGDGAALVRSREPAHFLRLRDGEVNADHYVDRLVSCLDGPSVSDLAKHFIETALNECALPIPGATAAWFRARSLCLTVAGSLLRMARLRASRSPVLGALLAPIFNLFGPLWTATSVQFPCASFRKALAGIVGACRGFPSTMAEPDSTLRKAALGVLATMIVLVMAQCRRRCCSLPAIVGSACCFGEFQVGPEATSNDARTSSKYSSLHKRIDVSVSAWMLIDGNSPSGDTPDRDEAPRSVTLMLRRNAEVRDLLTTVALGTPCRVYSNRLEIGFVGENGKGPGVALAGIGLLCGVFLKRAAGLFVSRDEGRTLYIDEASPILSDESTAKRTFLAFGKVLALAISLAVPATGHFVLSPALWSVLLHHERRILFDDGHLQALDPELYRNLCSSVRDVQLDADYLVSIGEPRFVRVNGRRQELAIVPGGDTLLLTEGNKDAYLNAMADSIVRSKEVMACVASMRAGFDAVLPGFLETMTGIDENNSGSSPLGGAGSCYLSTRLCGVDNVDAGYIARKTLCRCIPAEGHSVDLRSYLSAETSGDVGSRPVPPWNIGGASLAVPLDGNSRGNASASDPMEVDESRQTAGVAENLDLHLHGVPATTPATTPTVVDTAQRVVDDFWTYTRALNHDGLGALLEFWTGSRRVPSAGYVDLRRPRTLPGGVHVDDDTGDLQFELAVNMAKDARSLPIVSTCARMLVIPPYESYEALAKKMETAIGLCNEFELN